MVFKVGVPVCFVKYQNLTVDIKYTFYTITDIYQQISRAKFHKDSTLLGGGGGGGGVHSIFESADSFP